MRLLLLLLGALVISSCVVQIEEERPKHAKIKRLPTKPKKESVVKKTPSVKKEKPKAGRERRHKGKTPTYLTPLKGKPVKEGRGYFIRSSCNKFFRAVEAGKAIYVGKDLKAYGWTVIVKQRDGYLGVYTRTGELFVKEGEKIRRRQLLGKVGKRKGICGIYFELRDRRGKPIRVVLTGGR